MAFATKCVAHSSRTGEPCRRWAILGGTVCPIHGGSIKRVKANAQARIEELWPKALATLERAMDDKDPAVRASAVAAARDLLNRYIGMPKQHVDLTTGGQPLLKAVAADDLALLEGG